MRLFTVAEANDLLPAVVPVLLAIRKVYEQLLLRQEAAKHAAEGASLGGGGMPNGQLYVSLLLKLSQRTSEIESLGVQLKDYSRGLIDFPSMREGRVVLLCWQLGEDNELAWWHDIEAGFKGRQPL